MKCNKCNTHKPMGTSMVRNQAGIAVPAWVCSSCGQDIIKICSIKLFDGFTEIRTDGIFYGLPEEYTKRYSKEQNNGNK